MAQTYIILFGNLISVPLIAVCCLTGNFWVAIGCEAAKIALSGNYVAPAITMMQNASDASNSGLVVSAYNFYSRIA